MGRHPKWIMGCAALLAALLLQPGAWAGGISRAMGLPAEAAFAAQPDQTLTPAASDVTTRDLFEDAVVITEAGDYVITQSKSNPVKNTITIASGVGTAEQPCRITLRDVAIDVSSQGQTPALLVGSGAVVVVTLEGSNTLLSGPNCAGLQAEGSWTQGADGSVAAARTPPATVTLTGPGSLLAQATSNGAGIGGGKSKAAGQIAIAGGHIEAVGVQGAGIGAGGNPACGGGRITVTGGDVTARASGLDAAIGGCGARTYDPSVDLSAWAMGCAGGTITLTGGTVRAYSDMGAAIGGGAVYDGLRGLDGDLVIGPQATVVALSGAPQKDSQGQTAGAIGRCAGGAVVLDAVWPDSQPGALRVTDGATTSSLQLPQGVCGFALTLPRAGNYRVLSDASGDGSYATALRGSQAGGPYRATLPLTAGDNRVLLSATEGCDCTLDAPVLGLSTLQTDEDGRAEVALTATAVVGNEGCTQHAGETAALTYALTQPCSWARVQEDRLCVTGAPLGVSELGLTVTATACGLTCAQTATLTVTRPPAAPVWTVDGDAPGAWSSQPVTLTLSGQGALFYRLEPDGETAAYTEPIVLSDGVWTLTAWAEVDGLRSAETSSGEIRVRIRTLQPPEAALSTQEGPYAGDWTADTLRAALTSAYEGATFAYQVDEGPWRDTDADWTFAQEGQHTVAFRAALPDGSVTPATAPFTLRQDWTPPVLTGAREGETYWVDRVLEVSDASPVTLTVDGAPQALPCRLPGDRDAVVSVAVRDSAGLETRRAFVFRALPQVADVARTPAWKDALQALRAELETQRPYLPEARAAEWEGRVSALEQRYDQLGIDVAVLEGRLAQAEAYDINRIKLADQADLADLAQALAAYVGHPDLTAGQAARLADAQTRLAQCAARLAQVSDDLALVEAAVGRYTTQTVQRADIPAVCTALGAAQRLRDECAGNLTSAQMAAAEDAALGLDAALLRALEVDGLWIAAQERCDTWQSAPPTLDDEAALTALAEQLTGLMAYTGHLTQEERQRVADWQTWLEATRRQLAALDRDLAEAQAAAQGWTVATIGTAQGDALRQQMQVVQALEAQRARLTGAQCAVLDPLAQRLRACLAQLEQVETTLALAQALVQDHTVGTVTADQAADLQTALTQGAQILTGDNLTQAQKLVLQRQLVTLQTFADRLTLTAQAYGDLARAMQDLDPERVTEDRQPTLAQCRTQLTSLSAYAGNWTAQETGQMSAWSECLSACEARLSSLTQDMAAIEAFLARYAVDTLARSQAGDVWTHAQQTALWLEQRPDNLTSGQSQTLTTWQGELRLMSARLAQVEALWQSVAGALDGDELSTVTQRDGSRIQGVADALDALAGFPNLTREEQTQVETWQSQARALLGRLSDIAGREGRYAQLLAGLTPQTVTHADRAALMDMQAGLEELLTAWQGNLTPEQATYFATCRTTVGTLLSALGTAEQQARALLEEATAWELATVQHGQEGSLQALSDAITELLDHDGQLSPAHVAALKDALGGVEQLQQRLLDVARRLTWMDAQLDRLSQSPPTSAQWQALTALASAVDTLRTTYGGNLTQEERQRVEEVGRRTAALQASVESARDLLKGVTDCLDTRSLATVTSLDEDVLLQAQADAQSLLQYRWDNLTPAEQAALTDAQSALASYLTRIGEVRRAYGDVQTALASLAGRPVTVECWQTLQDLETQTAALLDGHPGNLTGEEAGFLQSARAQGVAWRTAIAQAAADLATLEAQWTLYDVDTVTGQEEPALLDLLEACRTLETVQGEALTSAQRAALSDGQGHIRSLLGRIEAVREALERLADQLAAILPGDLAGPGGASLPAIQQAAEGLQASRWNNLTASQRQRWQTLYEEACLRQAQVRSVTEQLSQAREAVAGWTADTVTADDLPALDMAQTALTQLEQATLGPLSAAQQQEVADLKWQVKTLLGRIQSVGDACQRLHALCTAWTVDSVTSDQMADLVQARQEAEGLLGDDARNLTPGQRTQVTRDQADLDTRLTRLRAVLAVRSEAQSALSHLLEATITHAQDERLTQAASALGMLETVYAGNLTAEEAQTCAALRQQWQTLMDRLDLVDRRLQSLRDQVGALRQASLLSGQESDRQAAVEAADNLVAQYGDNLTPEDRREVQRLRQAAVDVADDWALARRWARETDEGLVGWDIEWVTWLDRPALDACRVSVQSLCNWGESRFTAQEWQHYRAQEAGCLALLARIDEVHGMLLAMQRILEGRTLDNVTADHDAGLRYVEDAATFLLTQRPANLLAEEAEQAVAWRAEAGTLRARIRWIAGQLADLRVRYEAFALPRVTLLDRPALTRLDADLEALHTGYPGNLTAGEQEDLRQWRDGVAALQARIARVNQDYDEVRGVLSTLDVQRVTCLDRPTLLRCLILMQDLQGVYWHNLTAEQQARVREDDQAAEAMWRLLDTLAAQLADLTDGCATLAQGVLREEDLPDVHRLLAVAQGLWAQRDHLTSAEAEQVDARLAALLGWRTLLVQLRQDMEELQRRYGGITPETFTRGDGDNLEAARRRALELLAHPNLSLSQRETLEALHGQWQSALSLLREVEAVERALRDGRLGAAYLRAWVDRLTPHQRELLDLTLLDKLFEPAPGRTGDKRPGLGLLLFAVSLLGLLSVALRRRRAR